MRACEKREKRSRPPLCEVNEASIHKKRRRGFFSAVKFLRKSKQRGGVYYIECGLASSLYNMALCFAGLLAMEGGGSPYITSFFPEIVTPGPTSAKVVQIMYCPLKLKN